MNYIVNIFNKYNVAERGFLSVQLLNDNLSKLNADQRKIANKQLGNMVNKGTIRPVSTGYILVSRKDEKKSHIQSQAQSQAQIVRPPIKPTSVLEF
jgi:hypothetical protein